MNTTLKTLSALLLGAALVTPALAQDAATANNGNGATAQTADANAAPAAAPTTPVESTTTTANNSASAPAAANNQMAMNTTGNAADLSSVPDTSKKYSRTSRAKDYKSEAQVTKELNQKESGMNGATTAQ